VLFSQHGSFYQKVWKPKKLQIKNQKKKEEEKGFELFLPFGNLNDHNFFHFFSIFNNPGIKYKK
jgi:hypothetical protein